MCVYHQSAYAGNCADAVDRLLISDNAVDCLHFTTDFMLVVQVVSLKLEVAVFLVVDLPQVAKNCGLS